jgi:hypothetical protein
MATPTIKSTYSLDPATVSDLERLARRFGTSKSDVVRRAVQSLARQETLPEANSLLALEELQKSVGLNEKKATVWIEDVKSERAELGRHRNNG